MKPDLIQKLQALRPQIRRRWEELLRIERLHTPLANPDTLVFMFDRTLDVVMNELPRHQPLHPGPRPVPRSAQNPMRIYFTALEQAMLEALINAQISLAKPEHGQHAAIVAERAAAATHLCSTLRRIARREIETLDQICQPPARKRRR